MLGGGELPTSNYKFKVLPNGSLAYYQCLAWRGFDGPMFCRGQGFHKDPKKRGHLPSFPAEVPCL